MMFALVDLPSLALLDSHKREQGNHNNNHNHNRRHQHDPKPLLVGFALSMLS